MGTPVSPAPEPSPRAWTACRHCGSPLAEGRLRESGFCCAGCAYVFRLVHEHGLDGFYRIKDWAPYYAANFLFSHTLSTIGRGARDLDDLLTRARDFLGSDPVRVRTPSLEIEK